MDRLVRFDFSDKLRGEPREQADTLKILGEGGFITRDEGRKDLGKPPKGGNADELTVNANNQATIGALSGEPTDQAASIAAPASQE